jgi:hypothetical protein
MEVQHASQRQAKLLLQAKQQVLVVAHSASQMCTVCRLQGPMVLHLLLNNYDKEFGNQCFCTHQLIDRSRSHDSKG